MNICIAGGGRVGFHLARLLSIENHDVTVIEASPSRVEEIDFALDVRTVTGNASSILLLKEAAVDEADVFVAATGTDEVNLIAAATAKSLGAKQVVARVDNAEYIESNILYETVLGIDYLLSPDALSALDIGRYIESPGIVATETFGRGVVQLQQIRVTKSPTTSGKRLRDVNMPPGVLLGVISRKGATLIPHGDSIVEPGDLITLIGRREHMDSVKALFHGTEPRMDHVVIMGGASIGLHLAQMLEKSKYSVTLLDSNPENCKKLATILGRTTVVCRNGNSRTELEEEHIEDADVFIAATEDDERNIMAGVLAKEVGATRAIAVVHEPDFASLVSKLGIDHVVTPRASLANRVLKLVHLKSVQSIAVLEEGQVEIVEFAVDGGVPIIGKTLKEVFESRRGTRGALVASILRGDQVIVPHGDDEIQAGDSIILIATPDSLDGVLKLFRQR
ncbi:MAG TPA: Trk system potassium transporter TrkA [Candidatus Hydrogenedentes bacterium]|nr:Trk system potassium transporter TrkA [Candidatus Hydrogenedentota bacterium]HQH54202.1 Trk system potassium transporter TrkA [Candidatus Hydrogenedentota bacterium]HQM50074.1 Trk system potassium transporter TrkA [Candidatus Hydrogenedentota bacterium]